MDRDFKGVWIPYEDMQKYGSRLAILRNAYLSDAPNLTKYQIREARKTIPRLNLTPEKIKERVLRGNGSKQCEWCNAFTYQLEEHHYPISRKNGGTDVVNICGKCHSDYHHIERL